MKKLCLILLTATLLIGCASTEDNATDVASDASLEMSSDTSSEMSSTEETEEAYMEEPQYDEDEAKTLDLLDNMYKVIVVYYYANDSLQDEARSAALVAAENAGIDEETDLGAHDDFIREYKATYLAEEHGYIFSDGSGPIEIDADVFFEKNLTYQQKLLEALGVKTWAEYKEKFPEKYANQTITIRMDENGNYSVSCGEVTIPRMSE